MLRRTNFGRLRALTTLLGVLSWVVLFVMAPFRKSAFSLLDGVEFLSPLPYHEKDWFLWLMGFVQWYDVYG